MESLIQHDSHCCHDLSLSESSQYLGWNAFPSLHCPHFYLVTLTSDSDLIDFFPQGYRPCQYSWDGLPFFTMPWLFVLATTPLALIQVYSSCLLWKRHTSTISDTSSFLCHMFHKAFLTVLPILLTPERNWAPGMSVGVWLPSNSHLPSRSRSQGRGHSEPINISSAHWVCETMCCGFDVRSVNGMVGNTLNGIRRLHHLTYGGPLNKPFHSFDKDDLWGFLKIY